MVFEFLTSDEFLFWTALAVQSALIVWFVEVSNALAAGMTLASIAITVLLFPDQWEYFGVHGVESSGVSNWLLDNAWRIMAGVACYFLIGLLWATFRWWLYVNDARENYDKQKQEWLQPRSLASTARLLENRAAHISNETLRAQYLHWAHACRTAAATGNDQLSHELKPVWRDFVENGYRY